MNGSVQSRSCFRRSLKRSAAVHGILITALVSFSFIQGCYYNRQPKEIITFVDMGEPAPPSDVPDVKLPDLAKIEPQNPPEPEPVEESPVPDTIPDKVAEKPTKPKIEKSNKLVRNPNQNRANPKPPKMTQDQLRRVLGQSIGATGTGNPGREMNAWDAYRAYVYQVLYAAWQQPSGEQVAAGAYVTVEIRVDRSGTILRRNITRRSGDSAMDQSIEQVLAVITSLRALPPDIPGPYRDISIRFELDRVIQ